MTPAEERFEAIAIAHGRMVLGYLARRTTPAEEAADVYQEVLTTAWRKTSTRCLTTGTTPSHGF